MRCAQCPVANGEACLGDTDARFGHFCAWATEGDPVKNLHIVNRSALAVNGVLPPPTIAQKVVNLTHAVAEHVAAGRPLVDNATANVRLTICRGCPLFDAAKGSCQVCGCRMEIKVHWAEQECPEKKWPAVT